MVVGEYLCEEPSGDPEGSCQYHAFTAAVCLGTLPLMSPNNLLVDFAVCQLDATITLFTHASHTTRSRRLARNLDWMCKLKLRITEKVKKPQTGPSTIDEDSINESDEDGGLLGWRTRLVQRASKGRQTVRTIQPSPKTISPMAQGSATGLIIPSGPLDRNVPAPGNSIVETTDQLVSSRPARRRSSWPEGRMPRRGRGLTCSCTNFGTPCCYIQTTIRWTTVR